MRVRHCLFPLVMVFVALALFAAPPKPDEAKPAQSIPELQQQLEKILNETHTPGMSVAIVHKDGPEWVSGVGMADVASNRPATADSLFRIGSTSKAFAALSILKLAREGKLSLDDPVHRLVPDLAFKNRWEATDPVRVVHLLEHTTGWDDMHWKEYAKDARGWELRTALEFGKSSRVSRWPPGTRMAYCNTGPAVAAYIVEKLSGMRFEDYVQQNVFAPLGMKTATYFEPAPGVGATLYHGDGKTPYRYWNITYRPAGAINASSRDIARYVRFYLNRGMVDGVDVTPADEIDRMESPQSTWAAKEGLKFGYGLSNYWTVHEGFVYHGHTGAIDGGLTDMSYMPEFGVGYFYSTNSDRFDAFSRIGQAIRSYITRRLQKPSVPAAAPLPADADEYAGWYEESAPRQQMMYFMDRIKTLRRTQFQDGKLAVKSIFNRPIGVYVPVAGHLFRRDGAAEPVATAALLAPNNEGRFIYVETTLRRLPAWIAWGELGLTALFDLSGIAILAYAPFWMIGGLFKQRRRPAERAMRRYPLFAVVSLIAAMMIFRSSTNDFLGRLGSPTPWSVGLFLCTIVFAVMTILGVWAAFFPSKEGVRRGVRWFSVIVSTTLAIGLAYLAYWGVIGVRTWA